jgi:hypothetical protein
VYEYQRYYLFFDYSIQAQATGIGIHNDLHILIPIHHSINRSVHPSEHAAGQPIQVRMTRQSRTFKKHQAQYCPIVNSHIPA